jgi:hypothetical protein
LDVAVAASRAWYDDVFEVHGIGTECESGLWSALSDPPRWHSAAKTVRPGVPVERVLQAVDRFDDCSAADSYAGLDLGPHGFRPLFRALWVWRRAEHEAGAWPDGWSVVSREDDLATWNAHQDTTGVLLPPLLGQPRFTFLVRRDGGEMVAGAVLHRVEDAVELSNTWSAEGAVDGTAALVACATQLHPGVPVVGYDRGAALDLLLGAGFEPLGPHVVWVRDS